MSKPTNIPDAPCSPVASDCVVYSGQGTCEDIQLCKGDSVTDVLEKVMESICKINNMLDPESYNQPECLQGPCGTAGFVPMIENMMDVLCKAKDEINKINEQLKKINGSTEVKDIDDSINQIKTTLGNINTRIENAFKDCTDQNKTMYDFFNKKLLGYETKSEHNGDINNILRKANDASIVSKSLRNDIGSSGAIIAAMNRLAGGAISTRRMLSRPIQYGNSENWIQQPSGLADSLSNMMVVVYDILSATSPMFSDYSGNDCSAINIDIDVDTVDQNRIRLMFNGTIPNGFTDAQTGSTIEIYEKNNSVPMVINAVNVIEGYFRPSQPMDIDLSGITANSTIIVRLMLRSYCANNGTMCERFFEAFGLGASGCPNVMYTSSYNSCNFQFTWSGENTVMAMQIYDASETELLQQISVNAGGENVTGRIVNLDEGTTYKARLVINGEYCSFKAFTTATRSCIEVPAGSLGYTDDFSFPQGDVSGSDIDQWINEYVNQ